MIFAAGLGTRLQPFTLEHPKALVPVAGVPMLERVIGWLRGQGADDITVNVHHFAAQIVDFLRSRDNFGLSERLHISYETARLLDTGGGLLRALESQEPVGAPGRRRALISGEPLVCVNADILCDAPLTQMLQAHLRSGADITLAVSPRASTRRLWFDPSDLSLRGWQNLSDGRKIPGDLRTAPLMQRAFAGIHVVNTEAVLPLLREYAALRGEAFPIVPFYLWALGRLRIRGWELPAGTLWADVGSPQKLLQAEALLAKPMTSDK